MHGAANEDWYSCPHIGEEVNEKGFTRVFSQCSTSHFERMDFCGDAMGIVYISMNLSRSCLSKTVQKLVQYNGRLKKVPRSHLGVDKLMAPHEQMAFVQTLNTKQQYVYV